MSYPRTPIKGINVFSRRWSRPKYHKPSWTLNKYLQQMSFQGQWSFPAAAALEYDDTISINRRDPWPNICNRHWVSNGLHQLTNTSVVRRQGSSRLFKTDVAVSWIFPNRRRDSLKYCQPTTGLSIMANVTPPGPSEILAPGGPPTRLLGAPFICIIESLFVIFLCSCVFHTPFNV